MPVTLPKEVVEHMQTPESPPEVRNQHLHSGGGSSCFFLISVAAIPKISLKTALTVCPGNTEGFWPTVFLF